jgi:hypothetical protein
MTTEKNATTSACLAGGTLTEGADIDAVQIVNPVQ